MVGKGESGGFFEGIDGFSGDIDDAHGLTMVAGLSTFSAGRDKTRPKTGEKIEQ